MPRRNAASTGRERDRTGDTRLRIRQGVRRPLLAKSLPVTERQGREEAGGAGVLGGSPGPSAALMSLSPWPIRVPRIGMVLSGICVPKQPARPSWRAGRRPWEPPACQMLSYDCPTGPLSSCLLSSTSPLPYPIFPSGFEDTLLPPSMRMSLLKDHAFVLKVERWRHRGIMTLM
ncbi:uncharacterized protein LOC114626292 [Grammomys surdaster]|uniref:uncharacterized protein LOC114626292 n=1 Tax=Grammomys surdaster TaxID=491861 RepID=UPI00109EE457|nr:uncharacterized protein LOC114626292 [Grammomys surdaster]